MTMTWKALEMKAEDDTLYCHHENALHDQSGAGIVEYLLLVVFIGLLMIAALTAFSGDLSAAFSEAADSIPT